MNNSQVYFCSSRGNFASWWSLKFLLNIVWWILWKLWCLSIDVLLTFQKNIRFETHSKYIILFSFQYYALKHGMLRVFLIFNKFLLFTKKSCSSCEQRRLNNFVNWIRKRFQSELVRRLVGCFLKLKGLFLPPSQLSSYFIQILFKPPIPSLIHGTKDELSPI